MAARRPSRTWLRHERSSRAVGAGPDVRRGDVVARGRVPSTSGRSCGDATTTAGVGVAALGSAALPGAAGRRHRAARRPVLPRRPGRDRRPPGRHRRHPRRAPATAATLRTSSGATWRPPASRSSRASPSASTARPTPARSPADGARRRSRVVGSGLDVVYPPRNAALWRERRAGAVSSSARRRSARAPERWRFPARNRIIAALADVVVVVESHERGGSMHTVAEADAPRPPGARRARPGPQPAVGRHEPAAERRAQRRACDAGDVLVALGLSTAPCTAGRADAAARARIPTMPPSSTPSAGSRRRSTSSSAPHGPAARTARRSRCTARASRAGWSRRAGWFERVARSEP